FRELALSIYNELGHRKASTPMILMGRSDELRPGYYGPKDEIAIAAILTKFFLKTNALTFEKSKPLKDS
ncbi:2279_t:CDS:2, partial [Rhizophagus irregularis]